MDFMQAGKAPLNFEEQLKELADLKRKYPDHIYPFVCADPRRPKLLDLVKRYIEEEGFRGLKIYPPLGFYPFDERLYPVYEYAEKQGIPILTHCNKGKVYYRGKIPERWLTHPKTCQPLKKTENRLFTQHFTDPDNWIYVLNKFNRLKLCFGHFGGDDEWRLYQDEEDPAKFEQSWYNKIKRILMNPEFPNTYADISYTLADLDLVALLNVTLQIPQIRGKVLFGTDFYFSNIKGTEYKFCIELRRELGEENFRQIAEINPQRFLA
jgi:predicted TIM-barrel fold metal-dependent hydrolase